MQKFRTPDKVLLGEKERRDREITVLIEATSFGVEGGGGGGMPTFKTNYLLLLF